jgi:UrcA family protein
MVPPGKTRGFIVSNKLRSAGSAALAFSLTIGVVGLLAAEPAAARDLTVTAQSAEVFPTERVSTAGLDLTRAEGVRLLQAKVNAASRRVCNVSAVGLHGPSELSCRKTAKAAAAPQIANLIERSQRLAAAGLPSKILATLTVVGRTGE